MPTPNEFEMTWSLIGKVGMALACIVGIVKAYHFLRSQTAVAKLEEIAEKHSECIAKDKARLDNVDDQIVNIDKRLDTVEKLRAEETKRINESLTMLGTAQTALLNHMIDGNGIEEMVKERNELQKFFIKR